MCAFKLHEEYNSSGDSIEHFFDASGEGFVVPLYQREYTWEAENIDQLFDDIILGIQEFTHLNNARATTFLGTVILMPGHLQSIITPIAEQRAMPTGVSCIIDGQQRIATIALLAVHLRHYLNELQQLMPEEPRFKTLTEQCNDTSDNLKSIYSFRLGRGSEPVDKPKIIRETEDQWQYMGDGHTYHSPIAAFLHEYIAIDDLYQALSVLDDVHGDRVKRNCDSIDQWVRRIGQAHRTDSELYEHFPTGDSVATENIQRAILGFHDGDLEEMLKNTEADEANPENVAAAVYSVLLLSHYLLNRCGINCLRPTYEDSGFDMFQSLNTTGTPLTAWETFIPEVMRAEKDAGNIWDQTPSKEHLDSISELFEVANTNEQKNQLTNDLLRSVALCFDGSQLGNKFSSQNKWLKRVYRQELSAVSKKREFLEDVASVSGFFHSAWYMDDDRRASTIKALKEHPDGPLASLLLQYLRAAGSALSAPVLARFYTPDADNPDWANEFVETSKACAAFYTLWRSSRSTKGLDDAYRKFFNDGNRSGNSGGGNLWGEKSTAITSGMLKKYFREVLEAQGILDRQSWMSASKALLRYTEHRTVCRFVLFLAAHDRIADIANPGLTTAGHKGVCGLLNLDRWSAKDFKTLEHVAPQSLPEQHDWDSNIYDDSIVHDIGNLILLPTVINESVDRKNWSVKFLHYAHLGERSKDRIAELTEMANARGIKLSNRAIKHLTAADHNCTIDSILTLTADGNWDRKMINRRTEQIQEVVWDVLADWLDIS